MDGAPFFLINGEESTFKEIGESDSRGTSDNGEKYFNLLVKNLVKFDIILI